MNSHKIDPKEYADALVASLIGENQVEQWWNSPNRAFNGFTPLETWERENTKVLSYLYNHIYGGNFS